MWIFLKENHLDDTGNDTLDSNDPNESYETDDGDYNWTKLANELDNWTAWNERIPEHKEYALVYDRDEKGVYEYFPAYYNANFNKWLLKYPGAGYTPHGPFGENQSGVVSYAPLSVDKFEHSDEW